MTNSAVANVGTSGTKGMWKNRGRKGLALTHSFAAQFLSAKQKDVIISNAAFDAWAPYNENDPNEIVNHKRNTLRAKINATANSPAWTNTEQMEPFHVRVYDHGVSMIVVSAETATKEQSHALPRKTTAYIEGKLKQIKYLRLSIDFNAIPIELRLEFNMLERDLDDWKEDTIGRNDRLVKRINASIQDLSILISQGAITPANGAIKMLINSGEAEDVEQDDDGDDE